LRQNTIPRYILYPQKIPPNIVEKKYKKIADPKILENLISKKINTITENI